jgi:hypothetical protein
MMRYLSYATALALALTLAATAAEAAGKKKKKKDAGGAVAGTITAVGEGGKSITIAPLGAKKKAAQAAGVEVKITDKTRIDYIGIKDKGAQKLEVGLFVLVAPDDNDPATASVIAAGKVSAKGKKKKKADK